MSYARLFAIAFVGALVLFPPAEVRAGDGVECKPVDGKLSCAISIKDWLEDDVRSVLNNGWENTLRFDLAIVDSEEDEVVAVTFSDLSARCYIDPFDDPCLALWDHADDFDSYQNVDEMIDGVGEFAIVSVATEDLEPGTYSARLVVELNPMTAEQVAIIRSWLARSRGGHLVVGKNESSIFGTFVSVFANVRAGQAEDSVALESGSFAIP